MGIPPNLRQRLVETINRTNSQDPAARIFGNKPVTTREADPVNGNASLIVKATSTMSGAHTTLNTSTGAAKFIWDAPAVFGWDAGCWSDDA